MGSDCFHGRYAPALSQNRAHLPWLLPACHLALCPPTSPFISSSTNIAIVIQTPHLQDYHISIATANMSGTTEQRQLGPVEVDGHLDPPDNTTATGGRSTAFPPVPYPMSRAAMAQPLPTYTAEIGTQSQWQRRIHILASYGHGTGLTEQRPNYAQREIPPLIQMGSSGGSVQRATLGGLQILSV
jgi:hypothetical protein